MTGGMDTSRRDSDSLKFAALAAHQLKSPVAAAATVLKTLLGEYVGPLNPKQKEMLIKALSRCDQALESARRMLAIARAQDTQLARESVTDVAKVVRGAERKYREEARRLEITLVAEGVEEPLHARGYEAGLAEAVDALVSNALKYTPPHGRVRVTVARDPALPRVRVAVGDSGVGIPEADRQRVFEPFFRSERAESSARPGTGLGLAFVKSTAEAAGGQVRAEASDLGGTEMIMQLPWVPDTEPGVEGDSAMSQRLKVVIVGGAVAGPKAAAKIIRLMPDADVTIIERNQFLAVSGCGLPAYMSGVVGDQRQLLSTPAGTVRDPVFFQSVKNVHVMNQTEALAIDRSEHTVRIRDCVSGKEHRLGYDKLLLATGAGPGELPFSGSNLENVITLHGLASAERIRSALVQGKAHDVVIVGGGILGVEITESLVDRGCRVTIVEKQPQLLQILDWEMAALVERHLESKGVRILTETRVEEFCGNDNGKIDNVVTDKGHLHCDMVVVAIGFRPEVGLAQQAGLALGETGAIKVDPIMRTSDPDIYAAGDCVETIGLITGRPSYVPYGSVANRQGRVAAINMCGGQERFPGVLGSAVCKVFDYCVARTGLTERVARALGYNVTTALAPGPDRAHFMPNAKPLLLKVVVDSATRKLIGAQAVGLGMGEKRIDMAVFAISSGMTVDQIANSDLSYAPPYSPVMDNLVTATNVARNKMDGHMVGVSPMEVHRMLDEQRDFVFLDVRTPGEYEQVRLPGSTLMTLGTLRSRLDELPRDKEIITFCQQSLRGYEAGIVLRAAGFRNVRTLDGGIDMWPYEKIMG